MNELALCFGFDEEGMLLVHSTVRSQLTFPNQLFSADDICAIDAHKWSLHNKPDLGVARQPPLDLV